MLIAPIWFSTRNPARILRIELQLPGRMFAPAKNHQDLRRSTLGLMQGEGKPRDCSDFAIVYAFAEWLVLSD